MAVPFGQKLKTLLKLINEPGILNSLLSLRYSGYLVDTGWFSSASKKSPLDKNGNPIPWFTYPCNDFLSGRLNKELNIFEFGSGNSTLYFSLRAGGVTSVEHNKEWYELQKMRVPTNVKLIFNNDESADGYCKSIAGTQIKFDIIIVDGIDRVNCILNSVECLKGKGVLILDDSERAEYGEGIEFLLRQGFKRLDFWGISAGILFKKCTTVFYKDQNCLQI